MAASISMSPSTSLSVACSWTSKRQRPPLGLQMMSCTLVDIARGGAKRTENTRVGEWEGLVIRAGGDPSGPGTGLICSQSLRGSWPRGVESADGAAVREEVGVEGGACTTSWVNTSSGDTECKPDRTTSMRSSTWLRALHLNLKVELCCGCSASLMPLMSYRHTIGSPCVPSGPAVAGATDIDSWASATCRVSGTKAMGT
mmetsp:Transcript_21935/g.60710  ORF Transcript_21935/g.60710 Transcript_21935/m.60710 type:complete len:200 (-) Transcript_21935:6568-7167(-)